MFHYIITYCRIKDLHVLGDGPAGQIAESSKWKDEIRWVVGLLDGRVFEWMQGLLERQLM